MQAMSVRRFMGLYVFCAFRFAAAALRSDRALPMMLAARRLSSASPARKSSPRLSSGNRPTLPMFRRIIAER